MSENQYPHIVTKADYQQYVEDVNDFFEREGITNLTADYNEDEGDCPDPYFSWQPCDCCGRDLGGDRQDCSGYNPTTKEVHGPFSICVDCEYFAEYGQLDDTTMMDIQESTFEQYYGTFGKEYPIND